MPSHESFPLPRRAVQDHPSTDRLRLQEAYALTGLAWWEWDVGSGRLVWSEGMRRLAGLDHLDREPTIEDWSPLLDPRDASANARLEQQALTAGEAYRHVFRIWPPGGGVRYLESWTEPMRDASGLVVGLRGATQDVSDRETAQRAFRTSEARFRVVFDHAPHGMIMVWLQEPRAGEVIRANSAFAALLGYDHAGQLVGRTLSSLTPPDEQRSHHERFAAMASGRSLGSSHSRQYLRRDGSSAVAWTTTTVVPDQHGVPELGIAQCVDDTERRRHLAQLEQLARTDALTGLSNRSVVDAELTTDAAGQVTALLLMDLDRFKLVNDSQGHQVGDALLVQVAQRLRAAVPGHHTVSRLGGDEFVVVLHDGPDATAEAAAAVAHAVGRALREPFVLPRGERVVLTTSVGLAVEGPHSPVQDLLRHADLALYEAKDLGRNRVVCYGPELHRRNEERVRVERLLRAALREGSLRVELQPVVALADRQVVAAEALVRLDDPAGGLVDTGEVIRVAEDTGLVVGLDLWAMTEVCRLLGEDTRAREAGLPAHLPARVAVNVSGRTIEDGDFAARVRAVLDAAGVPPDRLAVELTETSLLNDSGQVEPALEELAALGVSLGMDDFGTGYSALAYLPRFPLAFLKIDMSFVRRLGTTPRADAIVHLAHAHGLHVVAEGVETAAQADALQAMGCELGQGWLIGRLTTVGPG